MRTLTKGVTGLLMFAVAMLHGAFASAADITVLSREDGSGTRGAFVELIGLEKNINGKKVDMTTDSAEITNSTAVMLASVQGNVNAIGYVSLGSMNKSVKALSVDGVTPSTESIKKGDYKIARPFNLVPSADISAVGKDFLAFLLSEQGQAVVKKAGYIDVGTPKPYAGSRPAGKAVVAGSSSVTPVMEKLKEAYLAVNPNAVLEIQLSDSTTGVRAARDGICDLGMVSRDLKDSERKAGLSSVVMAMDGIAIIVNADNPLNGLTRERIRAIFSGAVTDWSDVSR